MKSCVGTFCMIKILCFSRASSSFVLFQSIVQSISLIEAKQLYSCNNFYSLQVFTSDKHTDKKIKKKRNVMFIFRPYLV